MDGLGSSLHDVWDSVAPAWGAHADTVDDRGAAVTRAMLHAARVGPGDAVLELACGPGGVGLAAAEAVGPAGRVVLSDVAPAMTAIAASRADARGLGNVTTRTIDLEAVDEPDAAYDVVVCRAGLMFASDPARAVAGACRVLRPGGRAVFAVWGPRSQNPWLGVLLDAVGAAIGMEIPPPGVPGPFSLDRPDALHAALVDGGLAGVAVVDVPEPTTVESFEAWWAMVPSLAGPLVQVLASLPAEVVDAVRAHAEQAFAGFTVAGGYELPGVHLVGSGERP